MKKLLLLFLLVFCSPVLAYELPDIVLLKDGYSGPFIAVYKNGEILTDGRNPINEADVSNHLYSLSYLGIPHKKAIGHIEWDDNRTLDSIPKKLKDVKELHYIISASELSNSKKYEDLNKSENSDKFQYVLVYNFHNDIAGLYKDGVLVSATTSDGTDHIKPMSKPEFSSLVDRCYKEENWKYEERYLTYFNLKYEDLLEQE